MYPVVSGGCHPTTVPTIIVTTTPFVLAPMHTRPRLHRRKLPIHSRRLPCDLLSRRWLQSRYSTTGMVLVWPRINQLPSCPDCHQQSQSVISIGAEPHLHVVKRPFTPIVSVWRTVVLRCLNLPSTETSHTRPKRNVDTASTLFIVITFCFLSSFLQAISL